MLPLLGGGGEGEGTDVGVVDMHVVSLVTLQVMYVCLKIPQKSFLCISFYIS
jgi:hypothetical protein